MEQGVYKRGIARGWIAIGDIAFGILFSAGGFACGGIAFGGISVGILSLGGCALGVFALGGAAIALYAAYGGLAIAMKYAIGGGAIAQHANDAVAKDMINSLSFFGIGKMIVKYSRWFLILVIIPIIGNVRKRKISKYSRGGEMKIGKQSVKIFKMKNRRGFAALCGGHLTEGKTTQQAYARMIKAVRRTSRKKK